MNRKYIFPSCALVLAGLVAASAWLLPLAGAAAPQRTAEKDRQALVELENEWLSKEHDAAALEQILAPDFVHPVVTGDFLTKAQHIYYSTKYLPPANLKHRFENLSVRLYGDVGVVNGVVVASDERGQEVDRTIFTDVFVYRDGRWQAVNAQENRVEKQRRPPQ
jgi:predicted GNAT superfamily acetyltransferase